MLSQLQLRHKVRFLSLLASNAIHEKSPCGKLTVKEARDRLLLCHLKVRLSALNNQL